MIDRVLAGHAVLVTSRSIEAEYAEAVERRSVRRLLDRRGLSVQHYLNAAAGLRVFAELVTPTGEAPECRDPRDRMYLHCAVTAKVDYLVTSDDDLLAMGTVEEIPIVSPAGYLSVVSSGGG